MNATIKTSKNRWFSRNKRFSNTLLEFYKDKIPAEERVCIADLMDRWENSNELPLQGKKILFNCHLTLTTLFLIEAAMRGGAELIDFTAAADLVVHEKPKQFLKEVGVGFYANLKIPKGKQKNFYDICFDCGAGLLDVVLPKIGTVELTQTDKNLYKNLKYPIVTVDNSKTKQLETLYGTGDGFVRAFCLIETLATRQKCLSIMGQLKAYSLFLQQVFNGKNFSVSTILSITKTTAEYAKLTAKIKKQIAVSNKKLADSKYMLFGYGKVGFGTASALMSAGVAPAQIYVIEVKRSAYECAIKNKHNAFLLDERSKKPTKFSVSYVKSLLETEEINCFITATGVAGVVSNYFIQNDFSKVEYLINMGTPDEFGEKFDETRVLNNKKLFNFVLEYPTATKYFEAICTIYMEAGADLVANPAKFKPKLNNVDEKIDRAVLSLWEKHNSSKKWAHEEFCREQNEALLSLDV